MSCILDVFRFVCSASHPWCVVGRRLTYLLVVSTPPTHLYYPLRTAGPNLTDVLTPDGVEQLLQDSGLLFLLFLRPVPLPHLPPPPPSPAPLDVVARLLQHLPEGAEQTVGELRSNIRSPQFTQALATFNAALQSGELEPYLSQFGVNPADAAQVCARAVPPPAAVSAFQSVFSCSSSSFARSPGRWGHRWPPARYPKTGRQQEGHGRGQGLGSVCSLSDPLELSCW